MPKMLCDHKMYDAMAILYWLEEHGKCDADKLFGLVELLMIRYPLFSIDQLLAMCSKIAWYKKAVAAHAVAAQGLSDFSAYFHGQMDYFTEGKTAEAVQFKKMNPHIMVMAPNGRRNPKKGT